MGVRSGSTRLAFINAGARPSLNTRWSKLLGMLRASALAALAFGCASSSDAPRGVETGEQAEPLVGTVTVTLKTPSSVPVLSPVITASTSIWLGAGSEIVSGSIVAMGTTSPSLHAEPDALLNETWSRATAELRDRVRVRGILHAATRTLGNGVQIATSDLTPAFDPAKSLSFSVKYPTSTTGPAITLNSGQSSSIAPGQYGIVTLNSGATLTLSAGVYYLKTLTMEASSIVKLNQAAGPVIIYTDTAFTARGTFLPLSGTSPDLLIVHLGTTTVTLETLFNGAIIAPSATVILRAVSGIHTGYFYGKIVNNLDAHARVRYRAPLPVITVVDPPGPTCTALVTSLVPPAELADALKRYCKTCPSGIDTDRDGIQNCIDPCPYDAIKKAPGPCGCGMLDTDTDGDGTPNCNDQCPFDPNNISPGQCGCVGDPNLQPAGKRCTDTAFAQPNATCNGAGTCGDPTGGTPDPGCKRVTWRQSTYWFCPPPPPTGTGGSGGSGGSGTGGTSGSAGSGVTGGSGGSGGTLPPPATQATAQQKCTAKGQTLVRIDSPQENAFLTSLISGPTWIGANDITTLNVWRWTAPGTNNGDQFWNGGVNGTRVSSRYSNWGAGAPGTQRCAGLVPDLGGQWLDLSCTQALPYICEYHVPYTDLPPPGADGGGPEIPPPGRPTLPVPRLQKPNCTPQADSGLPPETDAGFEQLKADIDASYHDAAQGAGSNPPPANATCVDDPLTQGITSGLGPNAGCQAINVQRNPACFVDADCSIFGTGYVCRQLKEVQNCVPADASGPVDGGQCEGHSVCMQLSCPPPGAPCDQRDICEPGTEFDAGVDDASVLDASALTNDQIFGGSAPDAAPAAQYTDPASGSGVEHTWCSMRPQDTASVKTAGGTPPPNHGQSGGGSPIKIDFDPNLIFKADPAILPLGESNMMLRAAASLSTRVSLNNFLGKNFSTPIFEASIGIQAQRCGIDNTQDTFFKIFGLDELGPEDLGLPVVNSNAIDSPLYQAGKFCRENLEKYVLAADRAKKAFRDAQQLVSQFNAAKAAGFAFGGDLCNQLKVAAATVPFFPGGNDCPVDEPVDITINRFVDFYQAPGIGQLGKLTDVQGALNGATSQLLSSIGLTSFAFGGDPVEESQTIVNAPFFIGPVPMVLQIDVYAQYGVIGNFDVNLKLPALLGTGVNDKNVLDLARIGTRVTPYAAAGLGAFVGAGIDLGAVSATIGIEGRITLAEVSAPIFAGVGVKALVLKDDRQPPADVLLAAIGANSFALDPKSYKYFVTYDYGAGIDINNVLAGEINGRLRIKFFTFSRTWRKRVVRFNGWSKHFDIYQGNSDQSPNGATVSPQTTSGTLPTVATGADAGAETAGTTTNVVAGEPTMGLTQAQVPLMMLQHVSLDGGTDGGTTVGFDAGQVQEVFYDNLCCAKVGQFCNAGLSRPTCCPGSTCVFGPTPDGGIPIGQCVAECREQRETCTDSSECCPSTDTTSQAFCDSLLRCNVCSLEDGDCNKDADCCGGLGLTCNLGTHACEVTSCAGIGEGCYYNGDCCQPDPSTNTQNRCGEGGCYNCSVTDGPCQSDNDCCGGYACDEDVDRCFFLSP